MSYIETGELTGLPVLQPNETLYLEGLADDNLRDEVGVNDIAGVVYTKRRLIASIIDTDINIYREGVEYDEELSSEEVDKYVRGIQLGYDFAVSALSTVHHLRSSFNSFKKFIQAYKNTDVLPIRTIKQHDRMIDIITGNAPIEPILDPMYSTETPLSEYHLRKYCDLSAGFDTIFKQNIETMRVTTTKQMSDEQSDAAIDGFEHGAGSGIELYIQTWQQSSLAEIDTPLPNKIWKKVERQHVKESRKKGRQHTDQADDQY